VAGHGVGEYCALFAAGAFVFETGLAVVRKRGALMSRAPRGGMAAVANLSPHCVEQILSGLPYRRIDIAHFNSRMQCTLSGPHDEIFAPAVREAFTAAGAGFAPLNVSAALHCRCMVEVEREFADHLSQLEVRDLSIPVVANYTARPYPAGNYVPYLALQISNPVRWYESISWLIGRGCTHLHEIGPGSTLTVLNESIAREPFESAIQDVACLSAAPRPVPARRNQGRDPLPARIRRFYDL
jgi:malonyl CoA-acyl carrier protein transacylase